jgi:hypothetical protein
MDKETPQFCPICSRPVRASHRYPDYVCDDCAALAVDEQGRKLAFFNTSMSGGFEARYADTDETRFSHDCFVRGVRCRADEAYFGGIVIRPAPAPALPPPTKAGFLSRLLFRSKLKP